MLTLVSCTVLPSTAPTCDDGIRNQGEPAVDCGGPCEPCPVSGACLVDSDCHSLNCTASMCVEATCFDGIRNQGEVDVDCGGPCGPCANGMRCNQHPATTVNSECVSGICLNRVCSGTCLPLPRPCPGDVA